MARARTASRQRQPTRKQREFIARKIPVLIDEGYPQRQAIAIAYRMAGVPPRQPASQSTSKRTRARDLPETLRSSALPELENRAPVSYQRAVARSLRNVFELAPEDAAILVSRWRKYVARQYRAGKSPLSTAEHLERFERQARDPGRARDRW